MSHKTLISKSVQLQQLGSWQIPGLAFCQIRWTVESETPSQLPTILKTLHHIRSQEYWWSHISENNEFDFAATAALSPVRKKYSIAIRNNSQKLADYVDSLTEETWQKCKIESQWFQCDFQNMSIYNMLLSTELTTADRIVTMGLHWHYRCTQWPITTSGIFIKTNKTYPLSPVKMKNIQIFILLLITATIVSCKPKESTTAGVSTADYFNYKEIL